MYPVLKRFFDVVFAVLVILVLSPVLLIIVIILLLTGEHEVFYLQDRVGHNNRLFKIYKFATMLKNSPNIGTGSLTLRKDPRVLPFGHFLRISKLNELPQLINVLIGDMSFVGPRPLMPVDFSSYSEDYQNEIYKSKPGLTGIGSVIFRDEQKLISASAMPPKEFYKEFILPAKGALEIWYQHNKGPFVDTAILFLTGWALILPENKLAYKIFRNLPRVSALYLITFAA